MYPEQWIPARISPECSGQGLKKTVRARSSGPNHYVNGRRIVMKIIILGLTLMASVDANASSFWDKRCWESLNLLSQNAQGLGVTNLRVEKYASNGTKKLDLRALQQLQFLQRQQLMQVDALKDQAMDDCKKAEKFSD